MVTPILLVWRIGFRLTGLELAGVMPTVQGCCPVRCWKPVFSGPTTHENSTTMSLCGYGLAQYVVEFSLGIPTSYAGKLQWQNHWDVW
jgi:hypothetical protein